MLAQLVLAALAQSPPPPAALPPGCYPTGCLPSIYPVPPLQLACTAGPVAGSLSVTWVESPEYLLLPIDSYEVQIRTAPANKPFAVYQTANVTNATVNNLLPATTYAVSVRAHPVWTSYDLRYFGVASWGQPGKTVSCTTSAAPLPVADRPAQTSANNLLSLIRMSEGTGNVDYPDAHDLSDLLGASYLASGLYSLEQYNYEHFLSTIWVGINFADAAFTMYCVEAVPAPPASQGSSTTRGVPGYSDYQSCNLGPVKTRPDLPFLLHCDCAVAQDRVEAGLPLSTAPECRRFVKGVPTELPCPSDYDPTDCVCDRCSNSSAASSRYYAGMTALADEDGNPGEAGTWYSLPPGGACAPQAGLGTAGKWEPTLPCSWRRSPLARVVYGSELIAAGLSGMRKAECSYGYPDTTRQAECKPPTTQLQATAQLIDELFKALPMQPPSCDAYAFA